MAQEVVHDDNVAGGNSGTRTCETSASNQSPLIGVFRTIGAVTLSMRSDPYRWEQMGNGRLPAEL
jgi:hypothetical protein